MSGTERVLGDKSLSSSYEDLTAAGAAQELEEARRAEAAERLRYESRHELEIQREWESSRTDTQTEADGWQDLLGSGAILKRILKHGIETERGPQAKDICRISYELKIKDDNQFFERRTNVKIYKGDHEILSGLDIALGLMRRGEQCLLRIVPRFAYGDVGLNFGDSLGIVGETDVVTYDGHRIGPDTTIEARLELHDWNEEPEHETLSIAERMEIGTRRRMRGNWWYKRNEHTFAIELYRRALDVLDESTGGITDPTQSGETSTASPELTELFEQRIRVWNNLAAAQMMTGAHSAALQAVNNVLSCQPKNTKALYRKSRILSAMGDTSKALEAARQAAASAPDDYEAFKILQRCEKKFQKEKNVERDLAKRMLGTSGEGKDNSSPDKKPSRTKVLMWGSILLSILVGVASVLVYRYKIQSH